MITPTPVNGPITPAPYRLRRTGRADWAVYEEIVGSFPTDAFESCTLRWGNAFLCAHSVAQRAPAEHKTSALAALGYAIA